eukprot:15484055-Alexandrium_andersonii.AAC.1
MSTKKDHEVPKTAFATQGAARGLTGCLRPPRPPRLAPPARAASPGGLQPPQTPLTGASGARRGRQLGG